MNPHLERALLLFQQSRHELAEAELRQALADDPHQPYAHALLGLCLAHREQFDAATEEVRQAIHLAPDFPFAHYAHAHVMFDRNRLPEALGAINEAIRLNPEDADQYALLANIHLRETRWREALEAAEQGLQFDPEHVGCTNLRAIAMVKLGRKAEAGRTIDSALAKNPDNSLTHANQGWTLLEQGRPKQAAEHFREALRLDPQNEWARHGIIEALKAKNFIYAVMLKYFLWMGKFSQGKQWGILLAGYFGNRILAVVNRPGGQMVLFDTPGIHKPEHGLNRRMVETAVRSIGMVDVVFWMVDVTERYGPGDRYVRDVLHRAKKPVLLGLNKIDLIPKPHILRVIDQYRNLLEFVEIVPLSALSGDNVTLAGERLLAHLPAGEALYPEDFLSDRPERFFVAEMIREQILSLTRQEMPYVTGVLIEGFREDPELVRIEASILVERDSQKAILIGKGGSMLKEIGMRARQQIEAFLGTHVYLGLFVKVRQSWREDRAVLDEMGLGDVEGRPHKPRRRN